MCVFQRKGDPAFCEVQTAVTRACTFLCFSVKADVKERPAFLWASGGGGWEGPSPVQGKWLVGIFELRIQSLLAAYGNPLKSIAGWRHLNSLSFLFPVLFCLKL